MPAKKDQTRIDGIEREKRRKSSSLDERDNATLTGLVSAAITTGRKGDMPDDELSHLFALKQKLAKNTTPRTPTPAA